MHARVVVIKRALLRSWNLGHLRPSKPSSKTVLAPSDIASTGLAEGFQREVQRWCPLQGEDFVRTEFEILGSAFRRRKLLQAINQTDQLARTLLFEKAKTDSQAARRRNKERENAKAEKRLRDLVCGRPCP